MIWIIIFDTTGIGNRQLTIDDISIVKTSTWTHFTRSIQILKGASRFRLFVADAVNVADVAIVTLYINQREQKYSTCSFSPLYSITFFTTENKRGRSLILTSHHAFYLLL